MENFQMRLWAPAILMSFLSLTWFACKKDNTATPAAEQHSFHKDIIIGDASGNTAVLRLSASQASLLNEQDWSKCITLEALENVPDTKDFNEVSEQTAAPEGLPEVQFEVIAQQLQKGTKALAFHFTPSSSGSAERWQWVNTFTTSYDNIKVTVNYGCHEVYYAKRPYSYSNFIQMAAFFNRCSSGSWTSASSIPSYQMRSQTYYNNGTSFTITVW